jgi:hypothetical protein
MTTEIHRNLPGAKWYRAFLAEPTAVVRETPTLESLPFNERHLRCIWADPALRPPGLRTRLGESVTVENPGRWNLEAGPDFLDAVLLVGPDRRLAGDVEVHIRAGDWTNHGHDRDRTYRKVIAHVTWFAGGLPNGTLPPGTIEIALRNAVLANRRFSFEAIDLSAYPFAVPDACGAPCSRVLAGWSELDRVALLNAAGQERLRLKTARMAVSLAEGKSPEQVLYEEVLCALGYKHNRGPFRTLADAIPVADLRSASGCDPMATYALLAGVAGLLPARESRGSDPASQRFVRALWDQWWKRASPFADRVLPRSAWRLGASRPQNRPFRRMAAAAALFSGPRDLSSRVLALARSDVAAWFAKAESLLAEADTAFPFWQRREGLAKPGRTRVSLIGQERRAAILSNVVVPFLAANGVSVEPLLDSLPPEADNAVVRRTAHALFGHDHNPAFLRNGLRQQGLLQVFHDFCLNTKRGCADCLLAGSLQRTSGAPGEPST